MRTYLLVLLLGWGVCSASGGQPELPSARLQFNEVTVTAQGLSLSATRRGQRLWTRSPVWAPHLTRGPRGWLIVTKMVLPAPEQASPSGFATLYVSEVLNVETGETLVQAAGLPLPDDNAQAEDVDMRFIEVRPDAIDLTTVPVATIRPSVRTQHLLPLIPAACDYQAVPTTGPAQAGYFGMTLFEKSLVVNGLYGHCELTFKMDFNTLQLRLTHQAPLTSPPPARRPGR